ncbi:prisilkin-39-like [Dermacentor silvarum]|uniref:prisilkin-39-like n=1 Tax=Dermacentor silvarum TaxID=543639 RepID=UPI00189B8E38|nr:prisilkin-39-like [Dermacentor silvarum]
MQNCRCYYCCALQLFQTPAQYSFGYDTAGEYNDRQDGSNVANSGLYGYPDPSGIYRQMNYVGAVQAFRPTVGTDEKGPIPGVSGYAVFNAAPIILPVPTGSAQNAEAAAYGARATAVVPITGGYSRYGRPAPHPYALAAGAFEYTPYGRYGYGFNEAALGGHAYGSFAPYGPAGYAAGYTPGANAASTGYGNRPSAQRGYRRR